MHLTTCTGSHLALQLGWKKKVVAYLHWNSDENRADLPNEISGWLQLGSGEVMAFRDGDLLALA